MNHEQAAQLLGAYALDAVDEEEAALIEAHVAECPRCTAELAEHREVAGMLGNMGGDAPRELWDRISSQATRPVTVPTSTPELVLPTVGGAARRHLGPRGRRAPWVVAGAVLAVAAVVIALMAVQVARLDTKVSNLTALTARQGISRADRRPCSTRARGASCSSGRPARARRRWSSCAMASRTS